MRRSQFAFLVSAFLVSAFAFSFATVAQAQEESWGGSAGEHAPDVEVGVASGDYTTRYTTRPLTLNQTMLAVDVGFQVLHIDLPAGVLGGDENFASLAFGGRFGVIDDLTVGISAYRGGGQWMPGHPQGAISFLLAPDLEFGDVPLFGRYRFLDTDLVELGADLVLLLPARTDFAFSLGMPVRFHFSELFALDTGLEFRFRFNVGPDDDTATDLLVPLHPILSVTENISLHLYTGIATPDFDGWFIPLSLGFGYTIAGDSAPVADLSAAFGFPVLFNDDDVTADIWQIDVDATIYFQL